MHALVLLTRPTSQSADRRALSSGFLFQMRRNRHEFVELAFCSSYMPKKLIMIHTEGVSFLGPIVVDSIDSVRNSNNPGSIAF